MVAKVCKSDMLCKQTSWHRNSIDAYWCYMKARTRGSTSLWHATSSYFPQVWCSIKYQRVSAHRCFMFYMKAGRRKTPFKLPNAFRSSTTKQRWGRSTHNHTLNHCHRFSQELLLQRCLNRFEPFRFNGWFADAKGWPGEDSTPVHTWHCHS